MTAPVPVVPIVNALRYDGTNAAACAAVGFLNAEFWTTDGPTGFRLAVDEMSTDIDVGKWITPLTVWSGGADDVTFRTLYSAAVPIAAPDPST